MEIKNIEQLVAPLLKPGQEFVSHTCKRLLSTGENYGSVMLKVEIKILNEKSEEEIVHCVAKTCPPPGFIWEAFNVKVTFKKEIAIYHTIVPALNDFGREKGIECLIDFIPECKGVRLSIDPHSDEVDEDAVLLLENLIVQGYQLGDRFTGFDLNTSKIFLRDLATLHASIIAYKSAKLDDFNLKVLPYLSKHVIFDGANKILNNAVKVITAAASLNPESVPHISKLEGAMANAVEAMKNPPKGNEIFETIIHNDAWVNNTLLKFENGEPVKNKMVDFQTIEYGSLANDVIFFLYSSVELSILHSYLDDLMKFYYEVFIETLSKLEFNTVLYSYGAMMEEFAIIAKGVQFVHILFMLSPIMTLKGKVKELGNMEIEDMTVDQESLHENYYKKIQFVILDFVKRGWA